MMDESCHTSNFDQLKFFIRILKFYGYFNNQNRCFIFFVHIFIRVEVSKHFIYTVDG